jgi:hypothetical protein
VTPSPLNAGSRGKPALHALAHVDEPLVALGRALQGRDAVALQEAAVVLERALERAAPALLEARMLTPAQLDAMTLAAGRVAAQREAVARATASVERAIGVLVPAATPAASTYCANGYAQRAAATGSAWA